MAQNGMMQSVNCPLVQNCITNLLIPSLREADDISAYIDRFYEFVSMDDLRRIQVLNSYGFDGVCTM